MDIKFEEIVLRLHGLRPNSAQFVFFDGIFPNQMIAVRKAVIEFKRSHPSIEEIDVILFSPGGLADDAYRIIRTLRNNFKTVNVIVPFWAKSAATLLSLGANRIIMDEFGEFGPLDAQIGKPREDSPEVERESALNDEHSMSLIESHFKMMYEQMFIRIYEHKTINIAKNDLSQQLLSNLPEFFKPLLSQIDPYKLGEKKRILDIGAQYARRILHEFGQPKEPTKLFARHLEDYLINECPAHGYVIDKNVLERFVNNVYSSNIFGDEYQQTLQELSVLLMEIEDEVNFVGFIEPVTAATDQSNLAVNNGGEIFANSNDSTTIEPSETS